jgi:xylan 1,4-beta-xylosidase
LPIIILFKAHKIVSYGKPVKKKMNRHRVKIFVVYTCLLLLAAPLRTVGQIFNQQGLKAVYYGMQNLADSVTIRNGTINFDWRSQEGHPPDSVHWLGYVVPKFNGRYRFYLTLAGKATLWVNDSLLINGIDKTPVTFKGSINLTKGIQYAIKVKCSSTALIKLEWESRQQRRQVIPSAQLVPEGAELPPVRVMTNVIGRDPEVTSAPNGKYYMVHTSCYLEGSLAHQHCWDNNDGLRMWESSDLKNWTDLGLVWSIDKDGTWQKEYDEKGRRPLWAPEIHYIKKMKNWYMVYSIGTFKPQGIRTGLMKSVSGKPEGPYHDVMNGPITEGIDSSLFEDNGKVYFLRNHYLIALMNNDMTGFAEPFRPLQTFRKQNVGFEGSGMLKYRGKYYLYSAKSNDDMGGNTYDLNIAVADNIYGPYSDSWLALRHGGHSTLFTDKAGEIWGTLFGADDLSPIYITPSITRFRLENNGKILPFRGNARAKVILPTQQIKPVIWKYSTKAPPKNWYLKNFDDSQWSSGLSGFGEKGNTAWTEGDIWLRKVVDIKALSAIELENLALSISHNANVEVYLNGVEACSMSGFNKYSLKKIAGKAKQAIARTRQIVIAVHCRKDSAGQFIDAGLITWTAI